MSRNPFIGYAAGTACLHVDLNAAADNYRCLSSLTAPAKVAAVVKADAYGLGMLPMACTFNENGCRDFYVAHIEGGLTLSRYFANVAGDDSREYSAHQVRIFVLHGINNAEEAGLCKAENIIPVINSLSQWQLWQAEAALAGNKLPALLHFDTGLNRLGFSHDADRNFINDGGIEIVKIMSHLACPDEPDHPLNNLQLERFKKIAAEFPNIPKSLSSSAGIFLGADYYFDEVRPGAALYGMPRSIARPEGRAGLEPYLNAKSGDCAGGGIKTVTSLMAPLLQWRNIISDGEVGYGATYKVKKGDRVAIIPVGYADGYPRHLSNRGRAMLHMRNGNKKMVQIAGRISMDLSALDVSGIAPEHIDGAVAELFGPDLPIAEVASDAGTMDLELLTRLGKRFKRIYIGANVEAHNNAAAHA